MALIITFVNRSNLADVSDYEATVLVGDGTVEHSKVLYTGTVTGHERSKGWQMLLQQFVSHLPLPSSDLERWIERHAHCEMLLDDRQQAEHSAFIANQQETP